MSPRNHQCGRGLAWLDTGRWIFQCPPAAAAHSELGGHAAGHLCLGGPARESFRPHAQAQPARALCRHDRCYAVSLQPACLRRWPHVGHTLIVGPTGAGKSTALGLIAAQWFRYPNAKVFAFDRGYSSWLLTVAASGAFYDLAGPRTSLAFCPLAALDEDSDLTWAVGWVEALCELNGLKFTPRHRNAVAEAVARLQLSPTRTLTELSANVQDTDIRDALEHFTVTGPLGSLLDAERDLLSDGRFLTFEMENLLQLDDKAVIPVLLYLFRRIEQSLDGSPTLVLLDEAWSYLQQPTFRHRLKDWLKTMRRRNAVVVMATQQVS